MTGRRCHVSVKALQSFLGAGGLSFVLSSETFAYDPPPAFGLAGAPLTCGNTHPNFSQLEPNLPEWRRME